MPTTTDLANLVKAWLSGADCGLALHDCLEEMAWPLSWSPPDAHSYCRLRFAPLGRALAVCFRQGNSARTWWWDLVHDPEIRGIEPTLDEAQAAALAAFRRALLG